MIDCNCNDCKFMVRDIPKKKYWLDKHDTWAFNHFNTIKNSLLAKADFHDENGRHSTAEIVRKQANKMKYQFDKKEVSINYGDCAKFNKAVSFLPGVCQLDTQDCFEHRRLTV